MICRRPKRDLWVSNESETNPRNSVSFGESWDRIPPDLTSNDKTRYAPAAQNNGTFNDRFTE